MGGSISHYDLREDSRLLIDHSDAISSVTMDVQAPEGPNEFSLLMKDFKRDKRKLEKMIHTTKMRYATSSLPHSRPKLA